MSQRGLIKLFIAAIGLIVVVSFLFASFETVNAGERGVVTKWGKVDRVLDEGFHVVNPISEDVHIMDVKVQLLSVEANSASKDLQEVNTQIELNYHLAPDMVGVLFQEIGKRYETTVIQPAVQESVKSGTALFTAEEQINKRFEVKSAIKTDITERLAKFNIIVDEFNITDLSYSQEFDRAIEQKQVAEQQAKKAENDLKRVEFEQQQEIEKAKAAAEKSRLEVEALRAGSNELIKLRNAEALLEFSRHYKGDVPQILLIFGENPFNFLSQ